jgi:nucleoid-associated protein YgaU
MSRVQSTIQREEKSQMGLIDFVKEAGEDLLKRVGAVEEVDAEGISKAIHDHGFQIEDLRVGVADDVASVSGRAMSQADREKVVLLVGNTKGVARVNDELEVAQPEPEGSYYKVQRGDSLSKIAKTQYGDAMKYPVIFEANRPMLKDPDKIYPGQVLRIPPAEG